MERRAFLQILGLGTIATAGAFALPALPEPVPDPWQEFLGRVKSKVDAIVAREGRPLRTSGRYLPLCIDPPKVSPDGRSYTRCITIRLEPGGSLLQKTFFTWDEPYCTRLADF